VSILIKNVKNHTKYFRVTKKDLIIIYKCYVIHIPMCIFTEIHRQIIHVSIQFQIDISDSLSTTNQLCTMNYRPQGYGHSKYSIFCTPLASTFPLMLILILQVTIWTCILQRASDNAANPLESSGLQ
jgi:hypothetical protein